MKLIAVTFLLIFSLPVLCCEVNLYKFIYKINSELDSSIIKKSNCSKQTNDHIMNFLKDIHGRVSKTIIEQQAAVRGVTITPKVVHIEKLEDIINEEIELGENKIVKDLKSLTNSPQILSDSVLRFHTICESCHNKLGTTNIKLEMGEKTFWLTGSVFRKTLVWVANRRFNIFSKELSSKNFEQKTVYLDKDVELFEDITKVRFYQTTKTLDKGDIVTMRHLTPLRLVTAFNKVKLQVYGSSLKLSTMAKAKKSGFLDEYIEVINLKSNKKILAKVIDFNTVEIKL